MSPLLFPSHFKDKEKRKSFLRIKIFKGGKMFLAGKDKEGNEAWINVDSIEYVAPHDDACVVCTASGRELYITPDVMAKVFELSPYGAARTRVVIIPEERDKEEPIR